MPTVREAALAALYTALAGVSGPARQRDGAVPVRIPAGGLLILRDGDPGEPEITLSPARWHYEHRAEIEVIVQAGTGREAAIDTIFGAIGAAIAADRTLGGTVDWAEPRAPAPVDLPVEGGATIKAAIVPVVLHYVTADPVG